MTSVLVVGGAGAMGSLLVGLLTHDPEVTLTVVDLPVGRTGPGAAADPTAANSSATPPSGGARVPTSTAAPAHWLEGDIEAPSPDLLAALSTADVVILAIPEAAAERAAATLFEVVDAHALVVDTLSVKTGWFSEIAVHLDTAAPHPEVLSINPMFAPALGFPGRGVAVVSLHDGPRSTWFLDHVLTWGAELIVMEPTEHDRFMASIQAATHASVLAFGLAMVDLGLDLDRLWPALTPPHRTMLSLAARICAGDAHVYHDVQHANPYAADARHAVAEGLRHVTAAAESADPAAFGALLEKAGGGLASHRDDLEKHCVRLFEVRDPCGEAASSQPERLA